MSSRVKLIAASLTVAVLLAGPAQAGMRCGTHIITTGQSYPPGSYEVLKKCGQPDERYGDTWIYNKSSSVRYELRFDRKGRLIEIR